MRRIVLASESPRRRELMNMTGIPFFVTGARIEEKIDSNLSIEDAVMKLAKEKATDVLQNYENECVVAADTVVVIGNEVLGKPKDVDDARRMLSLLSGNTHRVITGVAILTKDTENVFYEETKVTFGHLDEDDIEWYIKSREYYDKAGGYAIQGKGIIFVEKIEGDYSNVVGLPMHHLVKELKKIIER